MRASRRRELLPRAPDAGCSRKRSAGVLLLLLQLFAEKGHYAGSVVIESAGM